MNPATTGLTANPINDAVVMMPNPVAWASGGSDIRVAVSEDYPLDHALHSLGIPSTLLVFPGEGHSLAKNPWHGKIKVREELKWLQKYGGVGEADLNAAE
jgi:hypothetical protein